MKATIERLKRDTFKMLSSCFRNHVEINETDCTKSNRILSPDFYDSRINTSHRKTPGSNPLPR